MNTVMLMFAVLSLGAVEDGFIFSLGYQSNAPAYVVLTIAGHSGRCAFGLQGVEDFRVTDEQINAIMAHYDELAVNNKKEFGKDVKIYISSKGYDPVTYDDSLDGNIRIGIYQDILNVIGLKIPGKYLLPVVVKDFEAEFMGTDGTVRTEVISKQLTWIDKESKAVSVKIRYKSPGSGYAIPQISIVDENGNLIFSASLVESKEMENAVYSISFNTSLKYVDSMRLMMESNAKELHLDIPIKGIPDMGKR